MNDFDFDDAVRRTIAEQHDRMAALEAENAKLREQWARLFDKTLELGTENAKLRELVDELYPLADYGAMDASELDMAHDLMRELGIEVTS